MQQRKRGNGKRRPKRERRVNKTTQEQLTSVQPVKVPRLTLYTTDPITGNEDSLSSLFYEHYRGYTIYSTVRGQCCIHGAGHGGCLRIGGKYVVFPDIEDAKALMKHFLAENQTAQENMNRQVPREAYICLNWPRREQRQAIA